MALIFMTNNKQGANNMSSVQLTPDDVLVFWFEEITPKQWWATSNDLD
jgi:uncharacterized protein (DUF924 family)